MSFDRISFFPAFDEVKFLCLRNMFYMKNLGSGGRSSTPIDRILTCVQSKFLKRKRLCVHQMLAVPYAYSCALNMEAGPETFPKMSKYDSHFYLVLFACIFCGLLTGGNKLVQP